MSEAGMYARIGASLSMLAPVSDDTGLVSRIQTHPQPSGCQILAASRIIATERLHMSTVITDRIEKKILLRAPRARVWRALAEAEDFGLGFGGEFDAPVMLGG